MYYMYDVHMYKFAPCCRASANVQHMYAESVKQFVIGNTCIITNLSVFC